MKSTIHRIGSKLSRWLIPDPPILEQVTAGRLVPAYPQPLVSDPSLIRLAFLARRNLLSAWTEASFAAANYHYRLFRRQVVVVNDPTSVREVLVDEARIFQRKGAMMRRALEPLLGDGLFISDGETWERRRPLVADMVHKRLLPHFGPDISSSAGGHVRRWYELAPGQKVNLLEDMTCLTAGIIARAVFGATLAENALQQIAEGFGEYQARVDSFNLAFFLGNPEGQSLKGNRALGRAAERVRSVVSQVIVEHENGRGDRGSIVDMLLGRMQRRSQASWDRDGLRNEAVTFFMAGHETTATTLTWAIYMLGKATWIRADLERELDEVINGREPLIDDLPKLPLLRAVVEETLRLYPPVPIMPRQALEATRIGGIDVEKDALILISPWLLHRSADLWEDPHAFRPERLMPPGQPLPFSYIPFSAGPRLCPGMNFGLAEAALCLATMMSRFRIDLEPGFVASPVCRLSLRPAEPVMVTLTPRRPE